MGIRKLVQSQGRVVVADFGEPVYMHRKDKIGGGGGHQVFKRWSITLYLPEKTLFSRYNYPLNLMNSILCLLNNQGLLCSKQVLIVVHKLLCTC